MWRFFCSSRSIRLLSVLQIVLAAGLLGAAASRADDARPAKTSDWSVGVTAGTLGLGGEVSYLLSDTLVLRANASYFEMGCGTAKALGAKCDYDLNLTGLFAGATIDIHPLNNGWRLSAGGKYVDAEFAGSYSGKITLGGVDYTDIGTTRISVSNGNSIAPYLGFGYDASHFSKEGSGFHLRDRFGRRLSRRPRRIDHDDEICPRSRLGHRQGIVDAQGFTEELLQFLPRRDDIRAL